MLPLYIIIILCTLSISTSIAPSSSEDLWNNLDTATQYAKEHELDKLVNKVAIDLPAEDYSPHIIEFIQFIINKDPLIFFKSSAAFVFITRCLSNHPYYLYPFAEVLYKNKKEFSYQSDFYMMLAQDLDDEPNSILHACIEKGNGMLPVRQQNALDIFIQSLCIVTPQLLIQKNIRNQTPLDIALSHNNPNYVYLLTTYMQPKDIPLPSSTSSPLIKSILTKNHSVPFIPDENIYLPETGSFSSSHLNEISQISVVTLTLALRNNDFKIKGYEHIAQAYYGQRNKNPLIFCFIDNYGLQQPYYPDIFTTAFAKNMRADQINTHGQTAAEYARSRNALPEVITLFENKYMEEKLENIHHDLSILTTL